ncbi:phage tail tape measure protein [Lactobacillus crispatus]|jgi:phage tail tape measure protein, TP901 family|uniref:phage tail tape measure protein n=2 Tax=Lactobacillus crispatus TaxID=47770 RepID=UPI0001BAE40B|nr:phage tail tape measure protein [Lactobacillus crispatus]QRD99604.1 tail tape measure protein [Lactobacillus phage vB_Lcr_AB1]DAO82226.1 MAG TPA: minor tail protein [Bacteriophage sp.]DAX68467.1 MAG TPA: minor tail protein [Caudoviricetes sp.]EEX29610.1 phage tail tape measure protein, TP901 family [Lactobacillus crispatus MV-3A-US]EFQ44075.1 phage tail tape measure protein, TP901 family [Lactobacillus crispatus CTV-05]
MAGRHVGIDIGVRVDNSVFDSVDRRIDKVKANAEQLNRVLSRTKMPDSAANGLDKLNRASGETKTQIDRLANSYKQVGTNNNLNRAQSDLSGIADKAKKATESTDQLKQSMNRAHESSKALGDMGSGFDRARGSSDRARESFDKTTGSSNKLKSGWDRLKGAGSALVQVGSSIATAMVPVAAAFMKANGEATKLADEYNVIKNLQETGGDSPRAARRNTREIQAENRRLSLRYGVDQNELARGSEQLLRRGYSGQQDLAAHKYFLQAARATNEDYNSIVNSAAPMLEQFGYKSRAGNSVRRMSKYTRDVLNKAAYVADLTSGDVGGESGFGESFKMMGSAAHSNGQTIDTMLGALGTLSNYGEEGSSAGTGMRQIITRLIKAPHSTAMLGALHDLGINPNSLYTRNGHLKQLGTIFEMLNRASRGKKSNRVSSDLQTLFGQTGFNDAQILMNHYGDMQHNVRESQNAARTGYISRLSRKNMSSLQNQLARTKQLATDMGMSFAKEVAPGISKALGYANKLLEAMRGMPKPVKTAAAYITGILGTLGASKLASGFLKANFGIGNGKGIGAGIGRLLFGKETGVRPRDPVTGQYIKGSSRQGGLINALKGNSFGGMFKLGRVQPGELTGKALVGRRLLGGAVGVGTALDVGYQGFQAYKDRHNAAKRSVDIGGAVGTGAGAIIGGIFGGPIGAALGAQAGKLFGRIGGSAVNSFVHGWQRKKPPKNFWSLENLGWSTKDTFSKIGRWGGQVGKSMGRALGKAGSFVKKNGKQLALTAIAPWAGIPALLYKNNPKFRKWANSVGKTIQNGFKGAVKWVKDLPGNIHKGWNRAVEASHKFFKDLPKNLDKTKKSVGKWASQTGKNISRAWQRGKKATVNFVKGIPGNLAKGAKSVANWDSRTGRNIQKTWNKGVTGVKKFVGGIPGQLNRAHKSVSNWSGKVGNSIQSGWNKGKKAVGSFVSSIPGQLGKAYKAVKDWAGKVGNTIKDAWNNFWGKAGDIRKGITNNLKGFGNDLNRAAGGSGKAFKYEKIKSHATGGLIGSAHRALVGEAGPELAYRAGSNARLLGANGPAITKVRPGEHILNARDTRKVMAGGLGRGLTLKGYATGNTKLGQTTKTVSKDYKKITDDATKSLKSLSKNNASSWSKINSQTAKYNSKNRANATKEYTGMRKSVDKQMNNMHDGVISTANSTSKGFGKAMGKMRSYAKDAMGDTIDQLNRGIKGIDKVLSQFGGNGSVIKTVHFAQGSDANGRLTQNTLSVVNDATSGPRQEALVSPSNELYFPHGDNVHLMIPRGWGVLNGTQTQEVARKRGIQHFAKGSGVSHSQLRKIASHALADPAKSFADMFTKNIKESGPVLQKGTVDLGKNASTHFGNPWSTAMWIVINNAIGDSTGKGGTREQFLKYAESTFSGVKYQMGAASKTLSDCSGMVMQALRHFGVDIGRTTVAMQHSSGVEYLGKSLSKTIPGDLVIFGHGTGAAGHVGIIKNPHTGTMFNETPPHARVTSIADDKGMGYGYYRVRGLHNAAQSKKTAAADKNLMALAKKELGSTALSWIKKNLSDDLGSLGSFSIGGDLAERAKALAGGLKKLDPKATKNGIAAVLGNWNFESGGLNPGAVNSSGGASGLGQWLGGRKSNLIAYARRHGTSWKNAGTQLSFAVKGEGSDSAILRSVLEGTGSVASLANKFSSEWERGGYNAQHVKGAMEIRKVLGYAKGGDPVVGNKVLVGEHGPELAEFKDPVHIYSNEKTRQRLKPLTSSKPKVRPVRGTGGALGDIQVTVNINGDVDGDNAKLQKLAKMIGAEVDQQVRQKLNIILDHIGDDTGDDDDFL